MALLQDFAAPAPPRIHSTIEYGAGHETVCLIGWLLIHEWVESMQKVKSANLLLSKHKPVTYNMSKVKTANLLLSKHKPVT